jgi:glutamate-1-semialdehyde 2,1-aminomutase
MSTQAAPVTTREEALYLERTPASRNFFAEARRYMPGGDSRSTLFYPPYPAVMARGEGCWLQDLDGNRLLDFTGNHSVLIHGYGHPYIMEAIERQLSKGSCFPGSSEPQLEFSRMLCERIPSIERIRFTSSGTESALNAVRVSRAFTGRRKIAKIEGGYHGTADDVMVSIHPDPAQAGHRSKPRATAHARGLPPEITANATIIPYNDVDAARKVIEAEASEIAAVLVEPLLGSAGMIPAERAYLEMLREVTERHGILLILDEVVSLRVAYGGAQEYFGIRPDLTCLGKMIGGGFPLGAFGGRADIMAMFDPSAGRPLIPHPGSLNANPIGMVAGMATFELLTRPVLDQLNARAEAFRASLGSAFDKAGVPVQITGLGSLFAMHLTNHPVRSYRDTLDGRNDLRHQIFLGLFNEGILIDPRGVGNLSTVLGDQEIAEFVRALRAVLGRVAEEAA